MSALYLGVMSGTSLDAIDIAACEVDQSSCRLITYKEYPFESALKEKIQTLIASPTLPLFGSVHQALGKAYGNCINRFLNDTSIRKEEVVAIGLHGQTLWHAPKGKSGFSLQIGDANSVAALTKITTITDFRGADIANGGEGAPLAPAFHRFYFKHLSKPFGVLNLGGIANLSIIDEDSVIGFDIGPANALMDAWIDSKLDKTFDKEGAWASSGRVNEELLGLFLQEEYFAKVPPKSTGKELFDLAFIGNRIKCLKGKIYDEDIQRTLLELSAQTISDTVNRYAIKHLIVGGGGTKNTLLMRRIKELCDAQVEISKIADALEAMMMAWLAHRRTHKERIDLSKITGSGKSVILGAIYEP